VAHLSPSGDLADALAFSDFASHLQQILVKPATHPVQAFPDLSPYLKALPLSQTELSVEDRIEINKHGVTLWNSCGKLSKSNVHIQDKKSLAKSWQKYDSSPDCF
jgi:hypothetical protein